jgi:hypothetical protein
MDKISVLEMDIINLQHQLDMSKDNEKKESKLRLETEKMLATLQSNQRMQELRLQKFAESTRHAEHRAESFKQENRKLTKENSDMRQ